MGENMVDHHKLKNIFMQGSPNVREFKKGNVISGYGCVVALWGRLVFVYMRRGV